MKLRSGTSTKSDQRNANRESGEQYKPSEKGKNRRQSPGRKFVSRSGSDTPHGWGGGDTNGHLNLRSDGAVEAPTAGHRRHGAAEQVSLSHNRCVLLLLKLSAWFLISVYFLVPAFIKLNPWITAEFTFAHRVRWPFFDLNDTKQLGLNDAYSFRVRSEEGLSLGVWHILPSGLTESLEGSIDNHAALLTSGHPIIIYAHGQAGTRAVWHRMDLYQRFVGSGYHVIAFDYRGFGDSDGYPSEAGLIEDGYSVYKWVRQHSGSASVYLWGHSMGSGVTTQLAQRLCEEGNAPTAVILEAPFTNILEAAAAYPLTMPFTYMPWYAWIFTESFLNNKISFSNDKSVCHITVPMLVLHAEDDFLVPYHMGKQLYEIGKEAGQRIQMYGFQAARGYGHKHIHRDPQLMTLFRNFTEGQTVHNAS